MLYSSKRREWRICKPSTQPASKDCVSSLLFQLVTNSHRLNLCVFCTGWYNSCGRVEVGSDFYKIKIMSFPNESSTWCTHCECYNINESNVLCPECFKEAIEWWRDQDSNKSYNELLAKYKFWINT